MNIAVLLTVALVFVSVQKSLSQIPNVYEFCSALMSDSRPASACRSDQCQGIPGKRGIPGIRGPLGLKGDTGEQGTCEDIVDRQVRIEAELREKFDLIPTVLYCSLGMKSRDIPDEWITASTAHDYRFAAYNGRLDERVILKVSSLIMTSGSWCTSTLDSNQWIQVDLGSSKSVSGVVTQGRPKDPNNRKNWVKTFKLSCGETKAGLSIINESGTEKVFTGNTDKNTKVVNKFPKRMTCRFIRLHPLTWNIVSTWIGICLRMEILRGECFDLL